MRWPAVAALVVVALAVGVGAGWVIFGLQTEPEPEPSPSLSAECQEAREVATNEQAAAIAALDAWWAADAEFNAAEREWIRSSGTDSALGDASRNARNALGSAKEQTVRAFERWAIAVDVGPEGCFTTQEKVDAESIYHQMRDAAG